MTEVNSISRLLSSTRNILDNQKKLKKIRGENFNVFSILKMERKENATHSAFLGELLNPKGSHLMGSKFLELFVQTVNPELNFSPSNAKLQLEYHVGKKNVKKRTGGRIDIYLFDKSGQTISIENKIDAEDQEVQIERYVNHNKERNTVFYLTQYGEEASKESRGDLKDGIDYHCISYKHTIIEWLYECLKESAEQPILRESIKQYIILIKKITHTMSQDNQKKLTELMFNDYETAKFITDNFYDAKNRVTQSFRKSIIELLNKEIGAEYEITEGTSTDKVYSQVWINFKHVKNAKLYFGIESFSGRGNFDGDMFIGIAGGSRDGVKFEINGADNGFGTFWLSHRKIEPFKDCTMNLSNPDFLKKLYFNKEFKQDVVKFFVKQSLEYIEEYKEELKVKLELV